jgi:intein/homing endonuclease
METIDKVKTFGLRNLKTTTVPPSGNCKNLKTTTLLVDSEKIKSLEEIFYEHKIDLDLIGVSQIPIKNTYVDTLYGKKRITGFYVNGEKTTHIITTNTGKGYEGTNEDKVLVKINEIEAVWKNIEDLRKGDKILLRKVQ